MEAATARLAEAYLTIETIKTQIKAIDYDLNSLVDNKWQAVEEAHEEEEATHSRRWGGHFLPKVEPDEDSM